jgi:hypothetical protein
VKRIRSTDTVDLAARDPDTGLVHTNQPLSSIEAFALALVEASSRLGGDAGPNVGDAMPLPAAHDDEAVPAAE